MTAALAPISTFFGTDPKEMGVFLDEKNGKISWIKKMEKKWKKNQQKKFKKKKPAQRSLHQGSWTRAGSLLAESGEWGKRFWV